MLLPEGSNCINIVPLIGAALLTIWDEQSNLPTPVFTADSKDIFGSGVSDLKTLRGMVGVDNTLGSVVGRSNNAPGLMVIL